MKVNDMKCCGNCKNQDITDGGTLQCINGHISEYNYATCPSGFCDEWEFDYIIQIKRKEYISKQVIE